MTSAMLEKELRERLAELAPEQQQQVLEYARALGDVPRRGVPGEALLRFSGTISAADAQEMERAIAEGCEGVDPRAW